MSRSRLFILTVGLAGVLSSPAQAEPATFEINFEECPAEATWCQPVGEPPSFGMLTVDDEHPRFFDFNYCTPCISPGVPPIDFLVEHPTDSYPQGLVLGTTMWIGTGSPSYYTLEGTPIGISGDSALQFHGWGNDWQIRSHDPVQTIASGVYFIQPSVPVYSQGGATLVNDNGVGTNLPGTTLARDDLSSDTLYLRFMVQPISDFQTEPYYAGLQFYEGGSERLGIGNAYFAWAYSAFNAATGDVDLNSANPETGELYQHARAGDVTMIVFKVAYNPGALDNVTVWLDPDLGQIESAQATGLTTTFDADASFDEIRLREGDAAVGADGWNFFDIHVAKTFGAVTELPEPGMLWQLGPGLALLSILDRRRRAKWGAGSPRGPAFERHPRPGSI